MTSLRKLGIALSVTMLALGDTGSAHAQAAIANSQEVHLGAIAEELLRPLEHASDRSRSY